VGRHDDGCDRAWRSSGGVGMSARSQYQWERALMEEPERGEMQKHCSLEENDCAVIIEMRPLQPNSARNYIPVK